MSKTPEEQFWEWWIGCSHEAWPEAPHLDNEKWRSMEIACAKVPSREAPLWALDLAEKAFEVGYRAGLAAEKWIDVKERLPREYEVVTVHQHGGIRGCAFFAYAGPGPFDESSSPQVTWYQGERTHSGSNEELLGMAVTHWQPLPAAPTNLKETRHHE
jgi:hypothetical protein